MAEMSAFQINAKIEEFQTLKFLSIHLRVWN